MGITIGLDTLYKDWTGDIILCRLFPIFGVSEVAFTKGNSLIQIKEKNVDLLITVKKYEY